MAATFNVNGLNATVTFSYTGPKDKLLLILAGCAEIGWSTDVGKLYADMTNGEKLQLVDVMVRKFMLAQANQNKENKAVAAAAAAEKSNAYDI